VLDCCHAGVAQAKDARQLTAAPPRLTDYDVLRGGDGRVIIASSRADELSWVLDTDYGLFTKHLLAGLNGGAAAADGFVRVFDLFEYLQPRVTAERQSQRPYFVGELGSNFPVALSKGGQKGIVDRTDDGYKFDAYVSCVDRPPDSDFVWKTLLPRLKAAGLRVAVSEDVVEPGVARVLGIGRAIDQSRRTVAVLSERYLADGYVQFERAIILGKDAEAGNWPLVPLLHEPVPRENIPLTLKALQMTDLSLPDPERVRMRFDTLIRALKSPLRKVSG
jgi:hypothetical protein